MCKICTYHSIWCIRDKTQTRELDYYNLDMIISVGYRVKSQNGIIFRKWANNILKDYMIKESDLFALERDNNFKSIINDIYQSLFNN